MLPNHPHVKIERTQMDNLLDGGALAGLLLAWTSVLISWSDLPDSVPRHFGLSGEPDAWGSPVLLFLLPTLGILLFAGLVSLLRIPHRFNYPWPITEANAKFQYRRAGRLLQILHLLTQWFFFAIVWETKELALGKESMLLPLLTPLFLLAIFSVIIGYVVLGNRTPTGQGGSP